MPRKPKRFSRSFGTHGSRVEVFERTVGGPIYYRFTDPGTGKRVFRSLGLRDQAKAVQWAREKADDLAAGLTVDQSPVTLARMFALYVQYATPTKTKASQEHDTRCVEMFCRLWGGGFHVRNLDSARWERFKRDRATGAVDSRGNAVPTTQRLAVRPRTVRRDLEFLKAVIAWAETWRLEDGQPLLATNPTKGLRLPVDPSPRREIADERRFKAVRKAAEKVIVQARRTRWRQNVRAPLAEILDLAHEAGRRIGAIRRLTVGDLNLTPNEQRPYGGIRWPAATDKMRKQRTAPLSKVARAAIEQRLKAVGDDPAAYLFPSPTDPSKPVSKRIADTWLRKAEQLAKVVPLDGTLWHAYRRQWATDRKHLPDVDVAAAGGWGDTRTLKIYQQVDEETMYEVITNPKRRVRES